MARGAFNGARAPKIPGRRWLTLLGALAAAFALTVHYLAPRLPSSVAEAILLGSIFCLLLASRFATTALRSMPAPQMLGLAGAMSAVLAGHFSVRDYDTFPFVEWGIYARVEQGDPRYFEYYVSREDGHVERVIPAELVPPLRKKLAIQLEQIADAIQTTVDPARRADLVRWYEGLFVAMAHGYSRHHAGASVAAIRSDRCAVTLERGGYSVACKPFWLWRPTGASE